MPDRGRDDQEDPAYGEPAERRETRREGEGREACEPDRSRGGPEREDLMPEKRKGREGNVFGRRQRRGVGDERPAVRRLPEKVGGRDSDRDENRGPRLPTREQAAPRRGEEPERDRDQVKRDRVFGEKRDSADRPRRQRPTRVVVLFGPDDAYGDRQPRQRLQSVGLKDDAP